MCKVFLAFSYVAYFCDFYHPVQYFVESIIFLGNASCVISTINSVYAYVYHTVKRIIILLALIKSPEFQILIYAWMFFSFMESLAY